ncbi:MAG: hypothetical protein MJZ65_02085 [Paludibacteraceae bacterium]|nr:hypothetical protein [Paludibacteraceae bacterium]
MKKLFSYMLMATALLISGQAKAINCPTIEGRLDVAETNHPHARKLDATNGHATKEEGDLIKLEVGETTLYFATFLDAKKAVDEGEIGKITLLDDFSETDDALYGIYGREYIIDLAGNTLTLAGFAIGKNDDSAGGKLQVINSSSKQATMNVSNRVALFGRSVSDDNVYSYFKLGENVTLNIEQYGILLFQSGVSGKTKCGYGIKVDIDGSVNAPNYVGIWVLGNIKQTTGNVPQINIHDGAYIYGGAYSLFAGGYAIWNIGAAELIGDEVGIYIKGGQLTLDGTHVLCTSENYSTPIPNGDGADASGSAIIVDSHDGYVKDGMSLTIKGDANISSNSGYGIEEVATKGDDKLPAVNISAGNVEGELGAIVATDQEKQHIADNGTLTGGTFSSDISEFVSNVDGVITYWNDDKGDTYWTIGNLPQGETWKQDFNTENSYVKLNNQDLDNQIVTEITGTKNVEYLAVVGNDKVVVKAGARLNVGEVALSQDAVLVIEPKAMVVVTSKQGIISTSNDNIIIEADATDYGQLLINPEVTFNTTPRATVELTTRSFVDAPAYLYERVAIPFGFVVDELSCEDNVETYFEKYNYDTESWQELGFLNRNVANPNHKKDLDVNDLNDPFVNYQFLTYNQTPGVKYTFKGKLVGNTSKTMTLRANFWNGFGNSYVAEMDVKTLLKAIKEQFSGSSDNLAVYYYKCVNQPNKVYQWKSVTELSLESPNAKLKLRPMEVFLIKNDGGEMTLPIDYKTMIWDTKAE